MTFSPIEKEAIIGVADKVAGHEDAIGAEALERLFCCFPQTKTYFSHLDLSHGSKDLKRHGGNVMRAIGTAAHHLGDIDHALSTLSDLHAQKLRVDPGNFKMLTHCILVTVAIHFCEEFTPVAHAALDKFLCKVSSVLVSKYR
ncbi:hemoglobin subunit alpha-5-like [Eleutherodactylus coqui]|uniref:Globin domain-containing protein n=1 Tax=Eleutherodactylus coqui TaxID=57060 RepID=A0A8J6B8G1_ELECQ|nr:hypothetical protein GDO78_018903 [Eleutherodactylus coqui]